MFWKKSINKIFFTTLIVFVCFVMYSFNLTDYDSSSSGGISSNVNLYTVNNDSYVSMTSVFLDSDSLEDKVRDVLDIMVVDSNKSALLPSYFNPILPKNTKVLDVVFDGDVLKIYFSSELMDITSEQSEKMIESITYTLLGFDEVVGVEIYVSGSLLKYVPNTNKKLPAVLTSSYGVNKSYDLSSNMDIKRVLLYYYTMNNDSYYLIPVTKYVNDKREKVEIIIEELSGFIYHDNLVSMLSNNIRLVDYKVSSDRVSLVFDEGFTSFSDVMVKPLFCSIFANYDVNFVDISVNGDKILEKSKKDIENY